jgi:general secretion pathway protein N
MSKWTWTLLIAAYTCVLLVNAPASVLSRLISNASNGRIELANTQGTLWRGSANPILHQRGGSLITLNAVHWDVAVLTLLTGKLAVRLNSDDESQTVPMDISISTSRIELRHAYIPLPAILLDEVSDFLKPAQLRGNVILHSELLEITRQGVQGAATADWLNASSLLSSIAPLGDYHFTFSSSSVGVDVTLNTTSGALRLAGGGRYTAANGLNFKGTAQAAKGNEEALRELLGHLGPEESPGINTFTLVPSPRH